MVVRRVASSCFQNSSHTLYSSSINPNPMRSSTTVPTSPRLVSVVIRVIRDQSYLLEGQTNGECTEHGQLHNCRSQPLVCLASNNPRRDTLVSLSSRFSVPCFESSPMRPLCFPGAITITSLFPHRNTPYSQNCCCCGSYVESQILVSRKGAQRQLSKVAQPAIH